MQRVYIETSIPNGYFEKRLAPAMVARRQWTRCWWDEHRARYEVVSSTAVLEELGRGEHVEKYERLDLVERIPILPIIDAIAGLVQTYVDRFVMPKDPTGDALHLALASYYKCDFQLTWNCKHLANANKFAHIRTVNGELGLQVPSLVTPLELLGEDYEP